jgi:outer membrane receptor protein involved in Fe transport
MIDNANQSISRTGYEERDLVDYSTRSLKLNGAVHYRLTEKIEAILQGNYGFGTTVYTGQDRYSLRNFNLSQFKAELKGSNFFVRAYTTQERSGESYAGGVLGQLVNESWKPSTQWFPEYFGAYAQGAFTTYAQTYLVARSQGQSNEQAIAAAKAAAENNAGALHTNARDAADGGRFLPGTPEFDAAADAAKSRFIPNGARFLDKTNLYHGEFMYNFGNLTQIADITVGANFRQYDLNSEGTLFAQSDDGEEFNINEYGGYVQVSRKLLADAIKLTGSIRYDKNQNFKGVWNPRISAVYTLGEHNFRASYQTGFRMPTTQNQYIDLLTPQARLIGSLPLFQDRYQFNNEPVYTLESVQNFGAALRGGTPFAEAVGLLKQYPFGEFRPEKVETYEVGYKSLVGNKLFVDAYYYFTNFTNYIGTVIVVQDRQEGSFNPVDLLSSTTRNVYGFTANRSEKIRSQGWAVGLNYALPGNYTVGGNVAYNVLANPGELRNFQTEFNTPRYRANLTAGNREVIKNLGFSVAWRWQESFLWQSTFVNPPLAGAGLSVIPAYHTFDAQVSYKIPSLKTILKVGGSNLFNNYYRQAWGNPAVGGLYYVQLTFDELLN